jgi:hypothetical protein
MAFVNEYISPEDVVKYGIEEVDRRFLKVTFHPEWTIDKERDVYLRFVASGRDGFATQKYCTLYWRGVLLTVLLDQQIGTKPNGDQWRHYKLLELDMPRAVAAQRTEIVSTLKEGLIAYQGGGVDSGPTQSATTFEF